MISKNKRDEIEIIAQMLKFACTETKKTHLMYKTNLCYNQLVYYMDFLLEKGFLDVKNGSNNNLYFITDKGREFLENIQKVIVQVE